MRGWDRCAFKVNISDAMASKHVKHLKDISVATLSLTVNSSSSSDKFGVVQMSQCWGHTNALTSVGTIWMH